MDAAIQAAWNEYEAAGRALDRAKEALDRPAIDRGVELRLEALERYQDAVRAADSSKQLGGIFPICTDCQQPFAADDPEQDCCADCLLTWLGGTWDLRI